MPAKKKPESQALALAHREPAVYNSIVQIASLVQDAEIVNAVTADTAEQAAEVLSRVRAAAKQLEALYNAEAAEHKAKLADLDKERKALAAKLEKADGALADNLVALYEDVDSGLQKRLQGPMGSKVSFSYRSVSVKVLDASKVPDKYIKPQLTREQRVDTAAIAAAIKATPGLVVPGVSSKPNYFLTTRAADIIQ